MKSNLRACTVIVWTLACTTLSGCGLEKPYPKKGYFAIDPGTPAVAGTATKEAAANNGTVLQVKRLRVASPFDSRTFVYKIGPNQYRSDYYNGFITPTPTMLTGELIQWLNAAGLYRYVVGGASAADHTWVLEGNVTEICGDYTNAEAPQAVIAARFFLLDDNTAETTIVFDKEYRQGAAFSDNTPGALAAAWGEAYRSLLEELAADLGRIKVPVSKETGVQTGAP